MDLQIGDIVRKGNGKTLYRVWGVSNGKASVVKTTTRIDPKRGCWYKFSEFQLVERKIDHVAEYTAIFNACSSLSELYDVASGIDWGKLDGVTVARITAACEATEAKLKSQAIDARITEIGTELRQRDEEQEAANEAEFNRIFVAGRGTVRIERNDDYVALAHCVTTEENRIRSTRWFVQVYCNDRFVARAEFDALLTYAAFSAFVASIVRIHGGN